jgi:hypothetical protein
VGLLVLVRVLEKGPNEEEEKEDEEENQRKSP